MTILFLTTVLPGGRRTGGELASQAFIDALRAAGHRVLVLGYRRRGDRLPLGPDDRVVAERSIETTLAGPWPTFWVLRALIARLPYSSAKYRARTYRRQITRALDEDEPSLVIVDHAQMAWAIPHIAGRRPHVYLAHNVEHELYAQAARATPHPLMRWVNRREARRIAVLERLSARSAREVWTLSSEDAASVRELTASRSARTFDLPVAVDDRRELPTPEADVRVLGAWTWGPNAMGLRWFLDRVVPLLPVDTTVEIGGAGTGGRRAPRSSVRFRGVVSDAQGFLRAARAVAVPATAGSGVQIKTLDAVATGLPVVATSVALRGIGDPPSTVTLADDPRAFAAALAALTRQPRDENGRAAAIEWTSQRAERFRVAVAEATALAMAG
ncbi:MAG TPA: glycosyltransferase [Solirubrobacteraceae bacterium]|nr:glycosyltransferase [Solirubrobacteraceae bacterium]